MRRIITFTSIFLGTVLSITFFNETAVTDYAYAPEVDGVSITFDDVSYLDLDYPFQIKTYTMNPDFTISDEVIYTINNDADATALTSIFYGYDLSIPGDPNSDITRYNIMYSINEGASWYSLTYKLNAPDVERGYMTYQAVQSTKPLITLTSLSTSKEELNVQGEEYYLLVSLTTIGTYNFDSFTVNGQTKSLDNSYYAGYLVETDGTNYDFAIPLTNLEEIDSLYQIELESIQVSIDNAELLVPVNRTIDIQVDYPIVETVTNYALTLNNPIITYGGAYELTLSFDNPDNYSVWKLSLNGVETSEYYQAPDKQSLSLQKVSATMYGDLINTVDYIEFIDSTTGGVYRRDLNLSVVGSSNLSITDEITLNGITVPETLKTGQTYQVGINITNPLQMDVSHVMINGKSYVPTLNSDNTLLTIDMNYFDSEGSKTISVDSIEFTKTESGTVFTELFAVQESKLIQVDSYINLGTLIVNNFRTLSDVEITEDIDFVLTLVNPNNYEIKGLLINGVVYDNFTVNADHTEVTFSVVSDQVGLNTFKLQAIEFATEYGYYQSNLLSTSVETTAYVDEYNFTKEMNVTGIYMKDTAYVDVDNAIVINLTNPDMYRIQDILLNGRTYTQEEFTVNSTYTEIVIPILITEGFEVNLESINFIGAEYTASKSLDMNRLFEIYPYYQQIIDQSGDAAWANTMYGWSDNVDQFFYSTKGKIILASFAALSTLGATYYGYRRFTE